MEEVLFLSFGIFNVPCGVKKVMKRSAVATGNFGSQMGAVDRHRRSISRGELHNLAMTSAYYSYLVLKIRKKSLTCARRSS